MLNQMYVEHDRYAAEFWMKQDPIDMSDVSLWSKLIGELVQQNVDVNIAYLKNRWIHRIDLWLNVFFKTSVTDRITLGYSDHMAMEEKFEILGRRIGLVKAEFQSKTDKQSTAKCFTLARKGQCPPAPNNCILAVETFLAPISTSTYSLKLTPYPKEFASNMVGAESIDVRGAILPPQIFAGRCFHLLESYSDCFGTANRLHQEYLIALHGGEIIDEEHQLFQHAIVIASYDMEKNSNFFNKSHRQIYLPTLIEEHVHKMSFIQDCSLANHVYDGGKNMLNQDDGDIVMQLAEPNSRSENLEFINTLISLGRSKRDLSMSLLFVMSSSVNSLLALCRAVSKKYKELYDDTVTTSSVRGFLQRMKDPRKTFAALQKDFELTEEMFTSFVQLTANNRRK